MLTDIGLATKQSWQFWQSWQQNQSWGLLLTQLLPPFASAGKTLANGRKHSTCWTAINICQQRLPLDQNFSPFVLVFAPFLFQQLLICLLFFDQGNASSILCPVACVSASMCHLLGLASLADMCPVRHMGTNVSSMEDSQSEQTTECVRRQP